MYLETNAEIYTMLIILKGTECQELAPVPSRVGFGRLASPRGNANCSCKSNLYFFTLGHIL